MNAVAGVVFCPAPANRRPPVLRSGIVTPARPTFHAHERALERLKISAAYLSDMLVAGAFVCVQHASEKTSVEGRLLWSPPDNSFVLVWQDSLNGDILTCMQFAGSHQETKMLEWRGSERVQNTCKRAKYLAVAWLLNTAVHEHSATCVSPESPAAAMAEAVAQVPKSTKAPPPLVELHFNYGKRETLPLTCLPPEFVLSHPVHSQLTARRFLADLLDSPWGAKCLADHVATLRWTLDALKDISIQRSRRKGSVCPRVTLAQSELACAVEDLVEGRSHYLAVDELDWSLLSPLGPEHPFFAEACD